MHYKSYDIHNKIIQAETSTLHHKNAPHKGDRYCIVLYNKNLSYNNGDDCKRSKSIQEQEPRHTQYLPVFDTLPIQSYRSELLAVLNSTKFPRDRSSTASTTPAHSKYGTNDAHVISLGISASRKSRKERAEQGLLTRKSVNMNNIKYPKLYYAFSQYINELHPNIFGENAMYHACIIAKNSQCEWHVDKHNIGHASLTCVGDYTGGELMLEEPLCKKVIKSWGYKKPKHPYIVDELTMNIRNDTTDQKVIDEVLVNNAYQNRNVSFIIEPQDKWLDLGANIGTFGLLALSCGASVKCVEPEPVNYELLCNNLASNFSEKYETLQVAVSTSAGAGKLYLCNTEYNKYRHSMHISKNRESIDIDTVELSSLLDGVDCIKMDIEGAEIDLLEQYADKFKGIRKLVFEYTFDADPSIARFKAIIAKLKKRFGIVHYTKFDESKEKYSFYPPCKNVYCSEPIEQYTICIPTYKRVDLFRKKTYKTIIQRYNLHDRVMLLLQNDEDEKAYTEAFPELGFMRTPPGLLQTVNYVAECFPKGHRIVMMHDDIVRLLRVDSDCNRHTLVDGDRFIQMMFAKMKEEGCHLGGVYPCNWPKQMAKIPEYTTDLRFIHDPLTFMCNLQLQLQLQLQYKSDFERTIVYYKHDGKVLRMNHYTICTAYNPKSEGGIGHRDAEAEKKAVADFLSVYGEYVKTVRTHKDGSTSMILHHNTV